MEETPQRVLVVIPHPDDAEFWCAGTVSKWTSEGASVHYLLCTDGGKGTSAPEMTSKQLSVIREGEQQDAANVAGVKDVVLLHHPDGELEDNQELRKEIVREIRRVQPDVVLCPEPYRKNLAWHRDHRITGQVALDAVFPYARDHLAYPEHLAEGLEPHKVREVYLWGSDQPDTFIDVTDTFDQKVEKTMKQGRPIFGVELRTVDLDDPSKVLPRDGESSGALHIRGPWVVKRYFKAEEDAIDAEGWFNTGDVAILHPDGTMQITDRTKDVIKSGGEWISSVELENAAVGHPAVAEAAAIGMMHPKWDERPVLFVVKQAGKEVTAEEVINFLSDKVAKWWLPDAVEFVDDIPHTATGKISKKDLRDRFSDYQLEI